MERRAKERLIGACILVALVVAVVPEMLSGPKPAQAVGAANASDAMRLPAGAPDAARYVDRSAVRNVTVDLATSKPARLDTLAPAPSAEASAQPPASAVPAPSAAASAAPDSGGPASTAPVSAAPVSTAPPNTAPPNTAPVSKAPQSPAETFEVQVGSFANRSNAEKLVHQLKAQGFLIYTNTEGSGAQARYRVRVGPAADRDSAERSIARLKNLGHAATLVSPR